MRFLRLVVALCIALGGGMLISRADAAQIEAEFCWPTSGGQICLTTPVATSTTPPTTTTSTSTTSSTTSTTSSTTTSSSTTVPAGTCPGAPNQPGGEDPFGGCWPGTFNTGVPDGTNLIGHTASCLLASGTYDARIFNCDVTVSGPVTITRSQITGTVRVNGAGRLTISDSNIRAAYNASGFLTSGSNGLVGNRLELTGGNRPGFCDPCTLTNSYVHGQETALPDHASGIRMSQNGTLTHNTLFCEPSNCSADVTGYPDFEPTTNWLIERNLFMSGDGPTYCAYGGATSGKPFSGDPLNATNIRFIDNIWRQDVTQSNGAPSCGQYGTIVHFDSAEPTNVWRNNTSANTGAQIPPRN